MAEWTAHQRRGELRRLLSAGRPVVARRLAREWGCSERTIRRQLQAMAGPQALPVGYDRSAKTWRSTAALVDLDPLVVTPEDRRALLFSLQAAAQLDGTPLRPQVRRLYEQLLATLPPERATDFQRMMAAVRFTGPPMPSIRPGVWATLLLCLEARETMAIEYTSGHDGETRGRDVDPYGLVMRDRHWILIAHCHRRREPAAFAVHRIAAAAVTDRSFNPPPGFMDTYLAGSFDGLGSTARELKVVLRVAKGAPRYVRDRVWSPTEVRTASRGGDVSVAFRTTAVFAVEREVRAEGGWVELLQPRAARLRLRAEGASLAKAHR